MECVEIGAARLYHGDCMDVLPTLPKVDAVVSDPPYGIADCWKGGFSGKHGWAKAGEDAEARNEWDATTPSKEVFDLLLTMGEVQCFWGGNHFQLPVSRGWLVWNKPERGFTLSEAELCWTSRDMAMRVIDGRRSDPDRVHPTQKTVAVMAQTLEKAKVPALAIVLDPFMGSGTTGVACLNSQRSFIGIEKERRWFDVACERIHRAQQQLKLSL